jgi:hypothetical protein
MDDEARRAQLGKTGRVRVEQDLAWAYQERAYLGVYRAVLGDSQSDEPLAQRTGG